MADQPPVAEARPNGWREDHLSTYFEHAFYHRLATFSQHPGAAKIVALDEVFLRFLTDWKDPPHLITPQLAVRSFSAFRTTAEHAFGGQIAEVFPLGRSALEYAAYAAHIHKNRELADVWLNRNKSETSKQACKSAFRITKILKSIAYLKQPLGGLWERLYEDSVNFGAHPNQLAMVSSMKIDDALDGKSFTQTLLHERGLPHDFSMKFTARVGVVCLDVFSHIFPDRAVSAQVSASLPDIARSL